MGVVTDFLDRVLGQVLVRKRIRMYVGADTATALYYFLNGFSEGVLFPGKMDREYEAFKEWLKTRIGDSNWHRILVLEKGMDEDQAREAFFELWDEWRAIGGANTDQ